MREPKKRRSNRIASGEFNIYPTCYNYTMGRKAKYRRKAVNEIFYEDFAAEIDILCLDESFPSWVLHLREDVLRGIGSGFRRLCVGLRDMGFKFFVKYPIEIDGRWRYADVFIPKLGLVVLLLGYGSEVYSPCNVRNEKELWFSKKFEVLCVYPDELCVLSEKIKAHPILTDKMG